MSGTNTYKTRGNEMETLNREAKAKLNEVYRVYGEDVQIAFENLVDVKFAMIEGTKENFASEWDAIRTMNLSSPELSDILATQNIMSWQS